MLRTTPTTRPIHPGSDDLVSECNNLSGGVSHPTIKKQPLQVTNPSTPFWQDEETSLFVTETSGAVIELA